MKVHEEPTRLILYMHSEIILHTPHHSIHKMDPKIMKMNRDGMPNMVSSWMFLDVLV